MLRTVPRAAALALVHSVRSPRWSRSAFGAVALAAALGGVASAHEVDPTSMTLRPGGQDYIYVNDLFGCTATITGNSTVPGALSLRALNMDTGVLFPGNGVSATVPDRVDQVFILTADASITTTTVVKVEISWVGSTYPSAPCNENNTGTPHEVTVTIEPATSSTGSAPAAGLAKDPVNTATGEFVFPEPTDLDLGGPLPLRFGRLYASRLVAEGTAISALGPNWLHTYDWKLTSTGNNVEIVTNAGRTIGFEKGFFDATWTLAEQATAPYQLVQSGSDFELCDPFAGLIYAFGTGGRLDSVRDRNGNTHTLTYTSGLLTQVADGLGRVLQLMYGGAGELVSVGDGTRTTTFGYTGGLLTQATDAAGFDTVYDYDGAQLANALMTTRTRPEGNVPTTQTYDGSGRVASQTTAGGHQTTFAYGGGSGTTITDPDALSATHTHGSPSQLTNLNDRAGNDLASGFDATGRRTSVTDRTGRNSSWTFHAASGRIASMTDANGATTSFGYTSSIEGGFQFHNLTSLTRADGATESFTYDTQGNLLTWTDPAGDVWTFTYDTTGQTLTSTNPAGAVTTLTYNADGTRATVTDDDGDVTAFAYDSLRRLTTTTFADTKTLLYAYDALDRVTTITDEEAHANTSVHDDNGNLTSFTNRAGETWTYAYDGLDRLTGVTDPLGRTTTQTFDSLGRAATVTDPEGRTVAMAYDALGHVAQVVDGAAGSWTRTYDAEGFQTSRTNPLLNTTTITGNALGRPSGVSTPLGRQTTFAHDALGRITSVTDPLGSTSTFTYDARGDTASLRLATGARCTYAHDELRNLTRVTDPGGNDWDYAYDAQGRLTTRTDPLGNQTSYRYDERDRIDRVTFPGALGMVDFVYDGTGQRTQQNYSDATSRTHTYDDEGRLLTSDGVVLTRDAAGRLASTNGIAITRTDAGLLETLTLAPGKAITYAYDGRSLLTSVSDWLGGTTSFTYDAAGRLTQLTRPNGLNTAYTYDDDDNLLSITIGGLADLTFTRDAKGRVATAVRNVPLQAMPALGMAARTFDAAGQIVGATYDAAGHLTADTGRTFTWSLGGKLTGYTDGAVSVALTYDGLGFAVQRVQGATTRDYVWNYALDLPSISVVRDGPTDLGYYVHTPQGVLLYAIAASNARVDYHFDELGNTLFLTNAAGTVTDSYAYAPFGELLASTGATENPFTFGGAFGVMREASAGLYAMRARYYDALSGRFLSRDPIDAIDPRGVNPYQYANGNPLAYVDPRGKAAVLPEDVPVRQVTIESRVVEVALDSTHAFGVDFRGLSGELGGAGSGPIGNLFVGSVVGDGLQGATMTIAGGQFSDLVLLDTLRDLAELDTSITTISSPKVVTLPERAGIVLTMRPTISQNEHVTLEVQPPRVAAPFTPTRPKRVPGPLSEAVEKLRTRFHRRYGIVVFPVESSILALRDIRTTARVPDRGSLLVGGLQSSTIETATRVPFLGDVPIIGTLFRSRGTGWRPAELQLFVTPTILRGQEVE